MEKLKNFIEGFNKPRYTKLPTRDELRKALNSFSKKWLVGIGVLFTILLLSTLILLQKINTSFMIETPAHGGKITEGLIDAPRFVNPVLSLSDTDKDITTLVYSGLTRKMSGGAIRPDLAESFSVSEDGLTYTFTLRDDIFFHDGKPITAEDVVFTINTAKDPILKSPRKISWEGVSVKQKDSKTIIFTLKQPYASFMQNSTIGILPAHIWKDISVEQLSFSDFNINAIGSGPYKIDKVRKKSSGIIERFELVPFKKFVLGKPYIKQITLKFYPNEADLLRAFDSGEIDNMHAINPKKAKILETKNFIVKSTVLPRIFGLFFNQSKEPLFTDKTVIKALDKAIDKERIVTTVLFGFATSIDSPLPRVFAVSDTSLSAPQKKSESSIEEAIELLEKGGWEINEDGLMQKKGGKERILLSFSIATGNVAELKQAAEFIKEDLEKIGALVEIKIFDISDLNQNVIRPRNYDALLFGQVVNHDTDLYAFWHSSQRNDPGLNIALYTNAKVDKILEESLTTLDREERVKKYLQFENEVKKDSPAVFIYSPEFIYVVDKNIKGLSIENLTSASDRFLDVHLWYKRTENIWKIFNR
ncbi:hypothetical protein COB64_02305 [Candidatus Wolfebacteria bacterium]|nr:MAG: hypothetical protein COB64_02305 [Candidatus Wolfebacteria bacterium]